jgi:hypothetical protein
MTHIVKPEKLDWHWRVTDAGIPDAIVANGGQSVQQFASYATDSSGNITGLVGGATATIPLVAPANSLAAIGDSETANWYNSAAPDTQPKGYLAWALLLSGQRMTVVSSQAVGGSGVSADYTGTALGTQLTTAIASGAKHLVMMGGLNDVINGASTATIQAAWLAILGRALGAGMRVWWCTTTYMNAAYGSYTVARQAQLMYLNEWAKQLANTIYARSGLTVVDTNSKTQDPASATGDFITNGSYDGLHTRNIAAYQAGKEVARVWNLFVPEAPSLLTSNADNQGYSSGSNNILDNGLMVTTGGTVGTGGTGAASDVALGQTGSRTGSATYVVSLVARSDGFGFDQQMVCTYTASGESVRLTTGDLKARVSTGDVLVAECEITCSSMTATRDIRFQLSAAGALTTKTAACMQLDAANDLAMTEGFTGVFKTLPFTVDTATLGALTSVTASVAAFSTGVGGVTMKIGRMSVRKIVAS